jgi:hypothetical protein
MLLLGVAGTCFACVSIAQDTPAPFDESDYRAFDFWIGDWRAEWLQKDSEVLDEYVPLTEMHHRVYRILGGKAYLELAWPADDPDRPGLRGMSIRYRDEKSGQWVMAQHWPSPENAGLAFTDQLRGAGQHGRHEVYSHAAQQSSKEKTVIRRYTFSDIADDRFRWDRALTTDSGQSWTTDLVMRFHRIDAQPERWDGQSSWPNYGAGSACTEPPHRAFDPLVGTWKGTVRDSNGEVSEAAFSAGRMLDGCAIAGFLQTSDREEFVGWSYSPMLQAWVEFSLSNQPGEPHRYLMSEKGGAGASFSPAAHLFITSRTEPLYESESAPPLSRRNWTVFTDNKVVVQMQTRDAADDEWVTVGTMQLERR